MTSIAVVRDVYDALGRMIVSQPIFIDDSRLATYQVFGWRLPFGAPVGPVEPNQIPSITMSPGDIRPWELHWSQWLASGETIATSLWLPGSSEIALSSQTLAPNKTSVWISAAGAPDGLSCLVTNVITSSGGRTDDQSVTVNIQQR